jgi:hypothetical protein
VPCPICQSLIGLSQINAHLDSCLSWSEQLCQYSSSYFYRNSVMLKSVFNKEKLKCFNITKMVPFYLLPVNTPSKSSWNVRN